MIKIISLTLIYYNFCQNINWVYPQIHILALSERPITICLSTLIPLNHQELSVQWHHQLHSYFNSFFDRIKSNMPNLVQQYRRLFNTTRTSANYIKRQRLSYLNSIVDSRWRTHVIHEHAGTNGELSASWEIGMSRDLCDRNYFW